ncbi:MAG TPA: ectonucleotide pyrophosphatase/phosphodiesterase [Thermogutta sp.]|nr:ectonucleotide pyrophosphatase/phosphodiesterase [Thermogutta sp.]
MLPRRNFVLVLGVLAWLGLPNWGLAASEVPYKDRTVILVSIDGLANFYLDDPRADIPTIRRLAAEGARADAMVTVFPSVTWCAHATLSTGVWPNRHGVLANDYIDRNTKQKVTLLCDPVFDKDQILQTPTIYDVAHAAGLVTAGVLWPVTRNARTLHFSAPDMPGDTAWSDFGTPAWIQELKAAGLPVDSHGRWCREAGGGVPRDWLYVRMARQLLLQHQPNLIMIHLVEPDHVQHRTGPRSDDAYWCASYSDDRIRDLVEAIASSPRAKSTYLVIVSDHGFFPFEKVIQPNVLLRQAGLISVNDGKPVPEKAWCMSQGGAAGIYIFDTQQRDQLMEQLRQAFQSVEGIQAVLTGKEVEALGQKTAQADPRCPDIWLAAEKGYSFSETTTGDEVVTTRSGLGGTHGYLPDQPDMWAMCVIWGPGIKPGTRLGKVQIVDIAPTIATLLGVELPDADGRALVKPN